MGVTNKMALSKIDGSYSTNTYNLNSTCVSDVWSEPYMRGFLR